jgi:hypothetical protein
LARIQARFDKMSEARNVVDVLKKMGYAGVYIDMADTMTEEYSEEMSLPGTEPPLSLSALVLKSAGSVYDASMGPLLAASPIVGGTGSFREIADGHTRLHAAVQDDKREELRELIKKLGGIF